MPGGPSRGDVVATALARWIGPDTARAVVRTFSDRVLAMRPDEIRAEDVPRLLDALRPMLRTLLGQGPAEHVLAELEEALR